jgi:hypothetical protein
MSEQVIMAVLICGFFVSSLCFYFGRISFLLAVTLGDYFVSVGVEFETYFLFIRTVGVGTRCFGATAFRSWSN